jgi:hypothetical protein
LATNDVVAKNVLTEIWHLENIKKAWGKYALPVIGKTNDLLLAVKRTI